jgi:preprotein translocase subunit SecD
MMYISRFKIIWTVFLTIVSMWLVIPSFLPSGCIPSWIPHKKIVLGLDLQGGVQLTLEAKSDVFFRDHNNHYASRLKKAFLNAKIGYRNLRFDHNHVTFELQNPEDLKALEPLVHDIVREEMVVSIQGKHVRLSYDPSVQRNMQREALEKSVEVIRRRVDEAGTVEPLIQTQGDRYIVLQIPGFQDPENIKKRLNTTGKLTFHWVTENNQPSLDTIECKDRDGHVYYVNKEIILTGEDVASAKAAYHTSEEGRNRPCVALNFTSRGTEAFSELTRKTGRVLAIVLDKTVLSAPKIQTHIPGGQANITGNQTVEECQELSALIRSGSLPIPLVVLEEKIVGPGLGTDSIRQGTLATLLAIAAVAVSMWLVYGWFGTFAVVAVAFNLLFLMALLVLLDATLTLPGIAGMAITVGMAVDANVLVNERIKEEQRLGRKILPAIDSGYRRAMNAVIDSNFTTLIAVVLLFTLGSGPVRGFAVTMGLGIVTSMFTAISLTRTMVSLWLQKFPSQSVFV